MCRAYAARLRRAAVGDMKARRSRRGEAYGGAPPFEREDKGRIRAEYQGLNDRVEFLERVYAEVSRSMEEGGAIAAVGQELAEARAARDATVKCEMPIDICTIQIYPSPRVSLQAGSRARMPRAARRQPWAAAAPAPARLSRRAPAPARPLAPAAAFASGRRGRPAAGGPLFVRLLGLPGLCTPAVVRLGLGGRSGARRTSCLF